MNAATNPETRTTAAADWLVRLRDPAISPAQIGEWLAWCEACPENKKEFAAMQALWHDAGGIEEVPVDPQALQADAYLAQVSVAQWYAGGKRASRRKWLRWTSLAAGIAALALAVVWSSRHVEWSDVNTTVTTATGVDRNLVLSDGTRVAVAAGSNLHIRFGKDARQVFLTQGEAYFEVTRDPRRPFTVRALDAAVTAVGTAFNVRAEQGIVKVAVTEGSVRVERVNNVLVPSSENIHLQAGHQVTLTPEAVTPAPLPVEFSSAAAWRSGTLRFVDEPLVSVVAAINRYAAVPVKLASNDLGERHYTGTVVISRIDEWLRGLPNVFPVVVLESSGAETVIRPRPHPKND